MSSLSRSLPTQWRSLEELAGHPEFERWVKQEFPSQASLLRNTHSRRGFLKVMGASLSLAGLAGCRWPKEEILPFAHRPENRIPGVPSQYATALELGGVAQGVLVTSFDGRPIKVEGNPSHPISQGAADAFSQAEILSLYDPDRSQAPVRRQGTQQIPANWDDFRGFARGHFSALRASGGEGLWILIEPSDSPTLAAMRERIHEVFPRSTWTEWEPASRDAEREGARLAFARPVRTQPSPRGAEVIFAVDSDLLLGHPTALRNARELAEGRRPESGRMSRLYALESAWTLTGAMADARLAVPPSRIPGLMLALGALLRERLGTGMGTAGVAGGVGTAAGTGAAGTARVPFAGSRELLSALPAGPADAPPFLREVAEELAAHPGRCLIVVGPGQPGPVHALAHLYNLALGNAGRTVSYTEDPAGERPPHAAALAGLCEAMRNGRVDTLLLLGGNPVYDAPADLGFAEALAQVPHCIHLGLYRDETAEGVLGGPSGSSGRSAAAGGADSWHLPRAHGLESWGDARSWDGTATIVQPLIAPLYDGWTPIELLDCAAGNDTPKGYDLVRRTWASGADLDFESSWRKALEAGLLPGTAFVPVTPALSSPGLMEAGSRAAAGGASDKAGGLEIVFRPDASVHDGRFSNNGWLQETPRPLTKLTWDNAALIAPATAARLGIVADDLVTCQLDGREIRIAAYLMPGQAPDTVVVHLGYGRTRAGRVGTGAGFNVYPLRTSAALHSTSGLTLAKAGRTYPLATTQNHHAIDRIGLQGMRERIGGILREGTYEEYRKDPEFARKEDEHPPLVSLWQEREYEGHRWGMSIDLNSCIGCNACVVACTAENNVPVVGKKRVREGREMHWLRVDRYFKGDPEDPQIAHQPVACVHCENAPCEQVCPVAATMHDAEGLNVMVYNRCIGTRYCSNNCPYKVRRFNFFNYRKGLSEQEKMAMNPDVTVRSRGVMEKCTYCIQRIEAVKIAAKNERRAVRDGEIVPACAQTCPTQAITFGDLNDPRSRVLERHGSPRSYALLGELNVKPRTAYLARLRNPAEGLGAQEAPPADGHGAPARGTEGPESRGEGGRS